MSSSFTKVASITASTKRPPVISGGKAGVPATNLATLKVTRPVMVSNLNEMRETLQLKTLSNIMECYCQGNADVKTGDTIVFNTVSYLHSQENIIRLVQPVPFSDDVRLRLVFEDLKR